jgi:UDPglucose 6-dehydrogenase
MNSLNIIGFGYVGSAIGYLCHKNNIKYNVCDSMTKVDDYQFYTKNISELVAFSEQENDINYYFIAVPTPSNSEGSCDLSIIHDVLMQLNTSITKLTYIIIKSTLVPGSCKVLNDTYNNFTIVLCPEFLREATYKDDIYNTEFVLIGFPENSDENVLQLFKTLYNHNLSINIYMKTYEECELFKYTLNVHLAVKIWYFNEIYEMAEKLGVNYQQLKNLFSLDDRIGSYGIQVPGHDGKFGYGLSCLPKETRGMMKLQEELGIENNVLKEIIKRNDYFRTK